MRRELLSFELMDIHGDTMAFIAATLSMCYNRREMDIVDAMLCRDGF